MAQLVEHLTSAQVVISWFVGLSPVSGSILTWWLGVWSLLQILCLPLFALPLMAHALALSLSLSKININFFKKKKKESFGEMSFGSLGSQFINVY